MRTILRKSDQWQPDLGSGENHEIGRELREWRSPLSSKTVTLDFTSRVSCFIPQKFSFQPAHSTGYTQFKAKLGQKKWEARVPLLNTDARPLVNVQEQKRAPQIRTGVNQSAFKVPNPDIRTSARIRIHP
jgi:hypothetical protein